MQEPHFFVKSFYKDAKDRTHILVDIRRFMDAQHYVELFVIDPNPKGNNECGVIRVVTYDEMKRMVEQRLLVEFEPRIMETDAVWKQRALDESVVYSMRRSKGLVG